MRVRTLIVNVMAAAPLLLAGLIAAPAQVATADTGCPTWNGNQPTGQDPTLSLLFSVDVVSPCDVWAVGETFVSGSSLVSRTLVEHWTGGSWAVVPSPSPGYSASLSEISAVSSTDIWAVGSTNPSSTSSLQTLILHWNGSAWSQVPSPSPGSAGAFLGSVTVVSAGDAWAVGGTEDNHPLALHWDGASWSQQPVPDPGGDTVLGSVSAASAGDVWALSQHETGQSPSFLLHWNGSTWAVTSFASPPGMFLRHVTALSATDAWAVGSYSPDAGRQQTLVMHWDGTSWTQMPSPNPGGTDKNNWLQAVTATSSGDVWAVGNYGTPRQGLFPLLSPLVLHWDGSAWQAMALNLDAQGTGDGIYSVSASGSAQAWVAGDGFNNSSGPLAMPVPVVPNVNGDLVGESFATLATYGLRGGSVIQSTNCPASSSGLIVGSDPPGGRIEPAGTAVNVVQCVTPATVTVPNVLSLDDASAQNAIRAAGLTVGTITWDNRCLAERGAVLLQSPNGDTQAAPGSAVNLTESSGHNSRNKPCGGTQA